jgi:hypothetical protein
MALTRKKRYKNLTMRRAKTGPSTKAYQPASNPVGITSITHAASTLQVVFSSPVTYTGNLPQWLNNGTHALSVAITSPTTATITMSGATAAGATTVPFQDNSFRNMSAGYVNAGVYTAV